VTTQELDTAAVEAFAGKMVGVLNNASLALMTSIGHQTGLFDTMAGLPPSNSDEIAEATGLNERYVREWLGAMVTGGIVDIDPDTRRYRLPPERAASLTRTAGPNNLASFMQFVPLLADVEQKVIESFRNGGGVPYSAYPRFQKLMAEASAQSYDAALISAILPAVSGLTEKLQAGIAAADIGCGSGHAINLMAQTFVNSRFTGYDFSETAVTAARDEARERGLTNAEFVLQDVSKLDVRDAFDLITVFDAIHDQAQPAQVLRNIRSALKPGGTFLMADIAASSNIAENREHPLGPFFYTVSTMHCMTVSLALNGEGLGAMWGEQKARAMLADAGFTLQDIKQVPGDPFNNYYIATTS
jgi:2-polyprenyl-3-methyl-5-hydroxy-6-metoxy-1,4-benzoquinol methylase